MHESSLARQILARVLAEAEREGAARVRAVRGWAAETERLSPEALRFHFQAHAAGTPAEGAALDLEVRTVPAVCEHCGERFEPDAHYPTCPACGSPNVRLLGPTGLHVESVVVEGGKSQGAEEAPNTSRAGP
ncbi:hydrogenase nickel incorporation protein HypA [Limnochorda pilosa]|uniref:Hydrogenase maturation factor HypA n=2 Tax=Limnochorda pilosa TaxID=1555112 RepID=A0A0K2SH45_LIMPI|nr:hydrogenase nickel incorporation protein HypA [Limnochorda pilosa]